MTRGSRVVIIGSIAVTILIVVGVRVFSVPSDPPQMAVSVADPAWVDQLSGGGSVQFEEPALVRMPRNAGSARDKSVVVDGLGPLRGADQSTFRAKLHRVITGRQQDMVRTLEAPGSGAGGSLTMQDAAAHTEKELYFIKGTIAQDLFERDEYWVLRPGEKMPRPRGYEFVIFYGEKMTDGSSVNIVFPIEVAKHPDLKAILEDRTTVTDLATDDAVIAFNSLPLEERKRRIEEHKDAEKKLEAAMQSLSEATRANNSARMDELGEEMRKLYALLLPNGFKVDTGSYTVSRLR